MLRCKLCPTVYQTIQEHFGHFELVHTVSARSQVTCGYDQCNAKLSNLSRYKDHFKKFHLNQNSVQDQLIQAAAEVPDDEQLLYKCAKPGCTYKCRSKGTLRSHIFWKHNSNQGTESQVVEEFSPAVSNDINIEVPPTEENVNQDQPSTSSANPQLCVNLTEESKEDILLKKFVHMGLTITSKYHVPDSSLAYILQAYGTLLKESSSQQAAQLREELSALGHDDPAVTQPIIERVVSNSVLNNLHGSDGPMRSFYMRHQNYAKLFPFLPPTQRSLKLNDVNKNCKYHFILPSKSIQWLFTDDSVYEQYQESKKRQPVLVGDLSDFHDGSAFKEHPLFSTDPGALQIIMFQDDIEIANGIGPASGKYKLTHMSFTLGNLFPWNRSKVDPIQLLLLCKEDDVSYFGFPNILEPIINDLKNMEENGVEIRDGEVVKASVLVLLGDNLGTHTFCGFSEGFATGKYFCRYCEESREEWKKRWGQGNIRQPVEEPESSSESSDSEDEDSDSDKTETDEGEEIEEDVSDGGDESSDDDIPLAALNRQINRRTAPFRTVESYNQCVEELLNNPDGVRGVVGSCALNVLKYFHVVGATPPCLPHDIYEGLIPYDMLLCIRKLMKTYKFTYAYLNRMIVSFEFKGGDKLDKPPAKFHARRKKIKGAAIQNWTFLRFLPLILDSKVTNKSDPVWIMILTLIEVVGLVASPVVSESSLPHIDNLIHKYLSLRTTLFREVPLRPKHKFFEHYTWLIKRHGPLSKSSTLRFESKHAFFRSELRSKKCLKNPTKTIARGHQYMQACLRLGQLFELIPVVVDAKALHELNEDVMNCVEATFGKDTAASLLYSSKLTFHITEYEKGKVIVTSAAAYPHIDCVKINIVMSDGKMGFAEGVYHAFGCLLFSVCLPINGTNPLIDYLFVLF